MLWSMMNLGQRILGRYIPHRRETFDISFACSHSFSGWWHIFLVAAQLGRSSCCSRSPPLFAQFCNQDISGSQLEEKKDKRPTYCLRQLSFGLSCQICRAIADRMQGSYNLWDSTRNIITSLVRQPFLFQFIQWTIYGCATLIATRRKEQGQKKWDFNIL